VKNAQRFLGGIAHYKAVGALADVSVEFGQLLRIKSLLYVATQLQQELLTGKQTRRLPFS
jgi:hypothetical protein